ncbi:hypothetical protein [Nitrosomonas sp.]|uniref:hypothetical protein n=1 Tax=Nitrosomonas sp. TaxID=42353 RepID=UPI0025D3CCB3|nr:hypothetical protein [Nitrosomonas sp.]
MICKKGASSGIATSSKAFSKQVIDRQAQVTKLLQADFERLKSGPKGEAHNVSSKKAAFVHNECAYCACY